MSNPTFHLIGPDSRLKQSIAQLLTDQQLSPNLQSSLSPSQLSASDLVAWIVPDLPSVAPSILSQLGAPGFSVAKVFVVFPLNPHQSLSSIADQLISQGKSHQFDLRCLAYDPSLLALPEQLAPRLLPLWFDRGHRWQKVALLTPSSPPDINFSADDLQVLPFDPPLSPPPSVPKPQLIPKPVKQAKQVSLPTVKKTKLWPKLLVSGLVAVIIAYGITAYGLLSLELFHCRQFKPEAGDSLQQFQRQLTLAENQYQVLTSWNQTLPLFQQLNSKFNQAIINAEINLLSLQGQYLLVQSYSQFLGLDPGSPHQSVSQAKLIYDKLYALESRQKTDASNLSDLVQLRQYLTLFPQLLPQDRKITAMILLQNNLELRPTGGFIGAVGLATIDRGKLLNLEIRDIYDLDSNLRGVVTPPSEINQYLGETSWFFRDANWSPDFVKTAGSANWFLDKEWGSSADLVIGINLNTVLPFIRAINQLSLVDGTVVNADNLIVSALNHRDNLAASTTRSEYLSLILKPLITQLEKADRHQVFRIIQALGQSLNLGEITLATRNTSLEPIIADLHLSGTIYTPSCDPHLVSPCFSDYFYLNQANVGINKANYYLTQNQQHWVEYAPTGINHKHQLVITNQSPDQTWPAGSYKAFYRVYLPATATNVHLTDNGSQLTPINTLPLSWFLEIPPLASHTLEITYQLPLASSYASYQFFVQKQPGLFSGPFSYTFSYLGHPQVKSTTFDRHLVFSNQILP